jgi:glutamyl-Q tRNA(Asp) synthetase
LAVWGVARAFSGKVWLRIEDHDRVRSRKEYERAILEDLGWLGFTPDFPLLRQSDRGQRYWEKLRQLESEGLVYPCSCSRKSIATVQRSGGGETPYPGTCRDRGLDGEVHAARRIRLPPARLAFQDLRLGTLEHSPADQAGDILARDRHGNWTYQFAVVVDDIDQGVDLVIRGEDILASTGRQIQIGRLLGRKRPLRYLHHPLVTRPDGLKLSKANRDTSLRDLRASGWSASRVLGEAASVLGLNPRGAFADIVEEIKGLAPA